MTALYVTHDQAEAFALGDRVAVLRDGRIVQIGTPDDVRARPADADVARFLGQSVRDVERHRPESVVVRPVDDGSMGNGVVESGSPAPGPPFGSCSGSTTGVRSSPR